MVRIKGRQLLSEGFERGVKGFYASGDVALTSGLWKFSDALIGTLTNDQKEGTKSVRVRNNAIVSMNFDMNVTGKLVASVKHAVYGADDCGTWELWASADKGASYTKVGDAIISTSTTLQVATFTYTTTGTARFDMRKTDGGNNRINFDTFIVIAEGDSSKPQLDQEFFIQRLLKYGADIHQKNDYGVSPADLG